MRLALVVLVVAACDNNTDPRWQLHHDRIIAIRVTPPHVMPGGVATIDAFVTSIDQGVAVQSPMQAGAPGAFPGLDTVASVSGGWQLTGPDASTLDAARAALGVPAGMPVPLELSMTFAVGGETLVGSKLVYFGDAHDNPTPGPITVDGAPPAATITVPFDTDVALAIDADPTYKVNWLTSCGSLNDDDNEHAVLLHVKPGDSMVGQLAVVVRDPLGGVGWQSWPIQSQPPPTP